MKTKLIKCFLIFTTFCSAQIPQVYTSFDGNVLNLYKYEGEHTMVLSDSPNLDTNIMSNWLNAMDGTYDFYLSCTGKNPSRVNPNTYINNRATIAKVPTTCGAGCGYLGATGIELQSIYFDDFYTDLQNNQYDQIVFYEFGRNFWFYTNKLQYTSNDPIVTGYAVFMRFMAMENLELEGANFGNWTFTQFKNNVKGLLNNYLANPNLNWNNTLGIGQGVPNSNLGGTDLFASFCWYLKDTYGECWLQNVWKYAEKRPDRLTTQDAVDNFIIASSLAAQTNLTSLFQSWRWPISNDAINYLNSFDYTIQTATPIAATCNPNPIVNINNVFDIGLRNVSLGNMQYSSAGYSGDNYQYYIDNTITSENCPLYIPKANLSIGSNTINITTGISNLENVLGWIDYNNNGVFQNSEIIINSNTSSTHTATFNVPNFAVTNTPLRMRLASDFYASQISQPCGTLQYGQTEDFTVYISNELSIVDIEKTDFELYPNPTSDIINIKIEEPINNIKIFDTSGRILRDLVNDSSEINLSDLTIGTYLIVVETEKNIYRKKIQKK